MASPTYASSKKNTYIWVPGTRQRQQHYPKLKNGPGNPGTRVEIYLSKIYRNYRCVPLIIGIITDTVSKFDCTRDYKIDFA